MVFEIEIILLERITENSSSDVGKENFFFSFLILSKKIEKLLRKTEKNIFLAKLKFKTEAILPKTKRGLGKWLNKRI